MNHAELGELLTGVLAGHGLELDDLEIAPAGRRRVIRVIVDGDGPAGHGPDLDQISAATRALSAALDAADAMGEQPYTLEVSSRGVSRPLTRPEHYRRNTDRLVTIVDATGQQTTGRITAADALAVTVEIAGESQTYPLDRIARAIVQVEFNRRLDDAEAGLDDQTEGE